MAFCFKGIVLVVLAMLAQPLKGKSVQPPWKIFSVNKARDIEVTKRNISNNFTFIPEPEIAKGLDYLKKKYPGVDWSAVTPTSSTGKRDYNDENLLKQAKRTSSFVFLNQSEIAKGLDYLKKKYPGVDWSAVTPTSTAGKREFSNEKLLKQAKRTSSFTFIDQSEIAKGIDYLKKKYPDVDWSAVTPTSTAGKRELKAEIMDSRTNGIVNDMADELKKNFQILDSSIQQRNDIPAQHDGQGTRNGFEWFLNPQKEVEELEHSEKKSPDQSTALIEEQLHTEY